MSERRAPPKPARYRPAAAQPAAASNAAPAHWINDVIDHLPVAVGLVGAGGTYVARSGKLGALLGDIIASRSGNLRDRWIVKDSRGRHVRPQDWPSERSLRGQGSIHTAMATFTTPDATHQLLISATPFVAPDGEARSIVMMQSCDLQKALDDQRAYLEAGFTEALFEIIQSMGAKGDGAMTIENAKGMLNDKLRLPPAPKLVREPLVASAVADGLTEREAEVLRLIGWGHTHKEIGAMLGGIAPRTVEFYRDTGIRKLKLKTRADIVRYCVSKGWLSQLD